MNVHAVVAGAPDANVIIPGVPDASQDPVMLRRFSVEQYHRMIEAGILGPDDRVELLDGYVVEMNPILAPHAYSVERTRKALERLVPGGWIVRPQQPISLSSSEPAPDVAVVRGRDEDFAARHPRPEEIPLLVEVADTTLRRDRELKLPLYAAAAIYEYWILNLQERQLEVYRQPQSPSGGRAAHYHSREIVAASGSVALDLDGQLLGEIAVIDLLPPE
jgi:Uma2 family endonuclease